MKKRTSIMFALLILFGVMSEASDVCVEISYFDGSKYKVSDFSFYTDHQKVKGTYIVETKDESQPLIVKAGKLWHEVAGENIKSIRLISDESDRYLNAKIALKNGQKIKGIVPLQMGETWESGQYLWIQGLTTKFGKTAKYKKKLDDIRRVETIEGHPVQFKIMTKNGEEQRVRSLEFGIYGTMPYPSPSIIGINGSVKVQSEGLEVEVPLEDIRRIAFDKENKITLTTKSGEKGVISFINATRIYGRLSTGELLFDKMFASDVPGIKLIEFSDQEE